MSKIVYSYLTDPSYIQLQESKLNDPNVKIDNIEFTPNYHNEQNDKIVDHNNLGLQVAGKYTTFIYLETINKNPKELCDSITNNITNETIMHADHEIYRKLKKEEINVVHNVQHNEDSRYKFLDLVVPYDSMYHVVTGKVEANVTNKNVVEHPMLCLYHNGAVMKFTWNVINDLFTNHVMVYLKKLE